MAIRHSFANIPQPFRFGQVSIRPIAGQGLPLFKVRFPENKGAIGMAGSQCAATWMIGDAPYPVPAT